jgi:hypothetical protein
VQRCSFGGAVQRIKAVSWDEAGVHVPFLRWHVEITDDQQLQGGRMHVAGSNVNRGQEEAGAIGETTMCKKWRHAALDDSQACPHKP